MNENTLTRARIADNLYSRVGISYPEAIEIIDDVFKNIIKAVSENGVAKIASFGSFNSKQKNERSGRNPKTKEPAVITARKVAIFSPSNLLKNEINSK